ncbi:MAG: sigma-54-dependent Fis family transcriptional regulator [Deltaproteobacteria bacterium]|nr:sigma-54-dependent Fis family transcriptional regulator [Deltaproteobacteria bacterium]
MLAATNRDLALAAREGRFRQDLLFRLSVLCIGVPPLRERRQDVEPIATVLLERLCATRGRHVGLGPDAMGELVAYDWPGNVRELLNVLERAVVFAATDRLGAEQIREAIGSSIFGHPEARSASGATPGADLTLAEAERDHILATFERLGGNVTRAAGALGVDRRTLQRKLRSFGRDVGED